MTSDLKRMMYLMCRYFDQAKGDKDYSLVIGITNESGTVHTIHPSEAVEKKVPNHMETTLIILQGVFYNRFIAPDTSPQTLVDGDVEGFLTDDPAKH